MSISFIHLSDIHFSKNTGDAYDLDSDLRNEVIKDIVKLKDIGNIKGILVCGDIAFSGKSKEYMEASNFLRDITNKLDIEEDHIYCVPGNHDVDQSIPKQSSIIKDVQDKIASGKTRAEIDDILAQYSRDPVCSNIIYEPIKCYNDEFAGKFKCHITPANPNWNYDFTLNEKYILSLVGLNSTITSNAEDHSDHFNGNKPMVLGQHQVPSRVDNTIYLSLCHHPPECWLDPEQYLKKRIDARVQIQLYGHKHTQVIQKTNTNLIINSGALQPSRQEDKWVPRYNWISIDVINKYDMDFVNVKVFPRVLNDVGDCFVQDKKLCENEIYVEYDIPIYIDNDGSEQLVQPVVSVEKKALEGTILKESISIKSLTYEFLNLSYIRREQILTELSLDRDEDDGVKHVWLMDAILERAKEQGCIEKLWRKILDCKKLGGVS